jgi:hypothetical protein
VDDDRLLQFLRLALGTGFAFANLMLGWKLLGAWRLRRTAIVTWPAPRPPYYGLMLGMGVVFGVLVLVNAFYLDRPLRSWFWELMMFVYYGYLVPLSTRIQPGFYGPGVWADRGGSARGPGPALVRYGAIRGVAWRGDPRLSLVLVLRRAGAVRRLEVPPRFHGEVRRLLRDRIASREIVLDRPELELFGHDERDDI